MYHRFVLEGVIHLATIIRLLMISPVILQAPWILSGTIRDNILFGKNYDAKRCSIFNNRDFPLNNFDLIEAYTYFFCLM